MGGAPPEDVLGDAVLAVVHVARVPEVQRQVAVEVQVPLGDELTPGLSDDDREDVAIVADCVQVAPAVTGTVGQASACEAAHTGVMLVPPFNSTLGHVCMCQ